MNAPEFRARWKELFYRVNLVSARSMKVGYPSWIVRSAWRPFVWQNQDRKFKKWLSTLRVEPHTSRKVARLRGSPSIAPHDPNYPWPILARRWTRCAKAVSVINEKMTNSDVEITSPPALDERTQDTSHRMQRLRFRNPDDQRSSRVVVVPMNEACAKSHRTHVTTRRFMSICFKK